MPRDTRTDILRNSDRYYKRLCIYVCKMIKNPFIEKKVLENSHAYVSFVKQTKGQKTEMKLKPNRTKVLL